VLATRNNADSLQMVHVIPNIALGLLYEPFMKWDSPSCPCVVTVQRVSVRTWRLKTVID
jgi:hypothetical protein